MTRLEQYNSFADLLQAADRVPSSGFDRWTRLMSPNRPVTTSTVAPPQPESSAENREHFSR
eukprot:2552325-Pyramimonas_sp.AAC.1